jgi:hypothetical protein
LWIFLIWRERGLRLLKRPRDALLIISFTFLILLGSGHAQAAVWNYKITASESVIDTSKTSAVVDTAANEITLPKTSPSAVAFDGEYLDYVALTPNKLIRYSFDGTTMVENTIASVPGLSNPVAAFTSSPYPDAIVATETGVTHYSFSGSMSPAYTVSGLTGVLAVGSRGVDMGVLSDDNTLKYYAYTGTDAAQVNSLSITSGISNPLDFALFPETYDCVVLEKNQAKYFSFDGTGLFHNPLLTISGLSNPKSISAGDSLVSVVDGNQIKTYELEGGTLSYSAALSVTSGLASPTCVALRPNARDMLVVDGSQVKYFMFDGSAMVLNPALSQAVAGIDNAGQYITSAEAVSLGKNPGSVSPSVRVRAHLVVPDKTSITWSVSANGGTSWVKKWRVIGTSSGTRLEVSNGSTWAEVPGGAPKASPSQDCLELWATVPEGNSVCWKAELATNDRKVTPKIKAPSAGSIAVVLESNSEPEPPDIIELPDGCFLSTTPTLKWVFNDPDPGDVQGAYQVTVTTLSGSPVWDSGKTYSSDTEITIPPDVLWYSGEYQFKFSVMVWDGGDLASPSSNPREFCVVAIERPRIQELVAPPPGQVAPDPANPATYIPIVKGMKEANLPKTQAGGKVGVIVNSIGVNALSAVFPYAGKTAVIESGPPPHPVVKSTQGAQNKTWLIDFWTAADLESCPSGTRVEAVFTGNGYGYAPTMVLKKDVAGAHAEGIVTTDGSVLQNWLVVLQGRKK